MQSMTLRCRQRKPLAQLSEFMDNHGELIGTQIPWLHLQADRRRYPDLIYCTFSYTSRPLPSVAEMDRLVETDRLLECLAQELDFFLVGSMMVNGVRDNIIYSRNGKALVQELYQRLQDWSPKIETEPDPSWSQYHDLRGMTRGLFGIPKWKGRRKRSRR